LLVRFVHVGVVFAHEQKGCGLLFAHLTFHGPQIWISF
jgi:hypothetical protein